LDKLRFWFILFLCSLAAIFAAISATRPRADVAYCIHALARRLSKTHNWAVCAPCLKSCAKYDWFLYGHEILSVYSLKDLECVMKLLWIHYVLLLFFCCQGCWNGTLHSWVIYVSPSLLEDVLWFSHVTLWANKSGIKNNTKIKKC